MALTAFVCIKGRVEVLGIVTLAIELCLGMTLQIPSSPGDPVKLVGQAACTVKVKVCGIKKSVSITMRRTITGSPKPTVPSARRGQARAAVEPALEPEPTPITFADVMDQADWTDWCGAFA